MLSRYNQSDVDIIQRMYDRATQKADEARQNDDINSWAVYSTQASTIYTTATILRVKLRTG